MANKTTRRATLIGVALLPLATGATQPDMDRACAEIARVFGKNEMRIHRAFAERISTKEANLLQQACARRLESDGHTVECVALEAFDPKSDTVYCVAGLRRV
ncbi:hypothetical protein [Caudoviricetes sp.]|nr:hypothetical protein [Caudoviricetes sp.]